MMGVTRDRTKETVTTQDSYTKSLSGQYGMASCNPAYTYGVEIELFLDQPENNLLNKEDKQRFQVFMGSVMYLRQVTRYGIFIPSTNCQEWCPNLPRRTWC